jgi:hypothetical protein
MVDDHLQTAVHNLIKRFVERQSVVLEAMRDLRPDTIMRLERRGSPKVWAELRRAYAREPNIGYWGENNEWKYRIHGLGCHLTHTITGEVIGWDVGSLKRFDWHWFVDYLEWLLKTDDEDNNVKTIKSALQSHDINRDSLRAFILPVLEQLEEAGVIRARGHRYILL